MDELYRDICEAVTYFRDAVRAAGGIIKESDPELAGPLTEQMSHFQTALAAMWIVKAWYETKCTPEKMKT